MKNKTLISIQITLWSCIIIFFVSIFSYALYQDFNRESISTFSNDDELEYTVKMEDAKAIEIDLVSEEVQIYRSSEDDIKIIQAASYNLKEKDKLRINTSSKTICVDKQDLNHFFNFFGSINTREIITVYIPENYNGILEVKTVSGSINVENLELEGAMYNSTSGDIDVQRVKIKENLELDTVSGDITLDQIGVNLIATHTISGGIRLREVLAKEIESSTTSGDVEVEGVCDYFKNSTTSGKLEIKLHEMFRGFSASSVSGDINVEMPENNGFKLKYNTTSGNLQSEFELDDNVYKDGSIKMVVNTTSGDLSIER